METRLLKPTIEQHSEDIQTLRKTLTELTASIHVLAESQKDLGKMKRSQIQNNIDIKSLQQSANQLEVALHKVHDRIYALETYQITTIATNKARSGLMEKVAQYGPIVIGSLLAFVTASVALIIKELSLH
jgi:predicted RNase H-like nuclease (RuvC/YqgF family)